MSDTSSLILLSTSACHLCEEAEVLLQQTHLIYQKIDIAEQEQWQKKYAIKIPVLINPQTDKELCWPFDIKKLQAFI